MEDIEDTEVAGWTNFKTVDTDMLRYDFRLAETSLAIDKASAEAPAPAYDRDGNPRDSNPDMGCYEYIPQTDQEQDGTQTPEQNGIKKKTRKSL